MDPAVSTLSSGAVQGGIARIKNIDMEKKTGKQNTIRCLKTTYVPGEEWKMFKSRALELSL